MRRREVISISLQIQAAADVRLADMVEIDLDCANCMRSNRTVVLKFGARELSSDLFDYSEEQKYWDKQLGSLPFEVKVVGSVTPDTEGFSFCTGSSSGGRQPHPFPGHIGSIKGPLRKPRDQMDLVTIDYDVSYDTQVFIDRRSGLALAAIVVAIFLGVRDHPLTSILLGSTFIGSSLLAPIFTKPTWARVHLELTCACGAKMFRSIDCRQERRLWAAENCKTYCEKCHHLLVDGVNTRDPTVAR